MDEPSPPLTYFAPPIEAVVPIAVGSVSTADVPIQLTAATVAWKPLARAVRYATFDAWTLAVFAALSLPCAIGGVVGFLLAGVLAWCAYTEFKGVNGLKRLDPAAPRRLAINQLVLAGAVVIYSAWNLVLIAMDGGMMAELKAHQAELGDMGSDAIAMVRMGLNWLYVTLLLIGGGVPVVTAWFYAKKADNLRAYVAATPAWILDMQRSRGYL